MVCYATDFHDLVQYCSDHDQSLVHVAINWRDGPQRGTALDFWLAERHARRQSGKQRHPAVAAFVENVLTASN